MYHILVCDDEKDIVSALRIYLTSDGYQVHEAYTGTQALEILAREDIQLVLLDVMMPQMDGLETFKIMQSRPDNKCKDTPVVMLTANATNGVREEYLKEGFDDFLAKPIDSKLLEEMIVRLLPENLVQYRLEDMD